MASITISRRLHRADSAFSRRFIFLTVFLRRLLGAVTAFIALAWSFHLPRPVVFLMKIDEKICKF